MESEFRNAIRKETKVASNELDLSQVGIIVVLLLDPQEDLCVPLIQARDGIIFFHGVGEAVNVLLLQMFNECLEKFRLILELISRLQVRLTLINLYSLESWNAGYCCAYFSNAC